MQSFIFDQLFTLKRLRGKIERNEITPTGRVVPALIVLLASSVDFVLIATDGTPEALKTYRLVQALFATIISLMSLHIGFRHIDQPFSWKKAGVVLYAIGWRTGIIGGVIFMGSLVIGSIITGSPLEPTGTFMGSQEVLSVEATLAGIIALIIPTSLAYLFGENRQNQT